MRFRVRNVRIVRDVRFVRLAAAGVQARRVGNPHKPLVQRNFVKSAKLFYIQDKASCDA